MRLNRLLSATLLFSSVIFIQSSRRMSLSKSPRNQASLTLLW